MNTIDIKAVVPNNDFEALHQAFSAFKEANDQRLVQIEQRLTSDVITEEKLQRIDRTLDETKRRMDLQMIERARPSFDLGYKSHSDSHEREHKTAFRAYARAGESEGLKAIEEKAMAIGSGPDGGYLVPVPAETEILRRLAIISPIRQIASVRQISTATYKKAFAFSGPASGWVAEADARPQSANQQIADMTFPAMELYAMPAATQTLLDDAAVDVEQWIAEEIDKVFAEQEGAAFVNGNGVNKPMGFLAYPKVPTSTWTWGKTGYLMTGAAGAFATSAPSDILFDAIYSIRAGYRQNARFVMNRKVQSIIRKFRAATGEYLWAPPVSPGGAATLMNFPVTESEDMPDIASDSYSIAFGDFQRAYLIVDRMGIRVLRDPYSAKPYILFYTTKRVGGGVQDFDAYRLIKFGTA